MSHASFLEQVPEALRLFGIDSCEAAEPVPGGTLNWNFRVVTPSATFFLRRYRDDLESERILGEHELVGWVADRGIPAPRPLRSLDGSTLVECGAGRWALLPWMPGVPVQRGRLNPAQVRAAGAMHGRLQSVLASHTDSAAAPMLKKWDKDESAAALASLIEVAKRAGEEQWIVNGIEHQLAMLQGWDVRPPSAFAALPCQLLHGDFHDEQLLFAGDEVSAVVDWEIWHTDPRAWEVVRSVTFSKLLDSELLTEYGAGFSEHMKLGEDETRLALDLWWQSRVVGLWAWGAYLLQGNRRVREFFPDMIFELERIADERWRERTSVRVVSAFCQ